MKYLLIFGLLLQSCAITKSETKILPGKELSKTSLGLRETDFNYALKEITPYSVSVSRNVCEAELFRMEYKGMRETVHKRQELHCAGAYPNYVAFQLTTFGIPFLYDLVSGFGIFREMCDKGPPEISTDTQETTTSVTQEIIDSKNTICRDVPISGVEVTAEINNNISTIVSSTAGVAALTPELKRSIESLDRDVSVSYKYMAETVKTTIKQAAKPATQVAKTDNQNADKNSIKMVVASPELQMTAKTEGQNAAEKSDGKATTLNQEQQKVKTDMLTPGPFGLDLPNIPAGSEKKPVQSFFIVRFAYNKATVNEESLRDLEMFAETMKNNPDMVSIVEGHTDSLGGTEVNRKMSFRRASAIRNLLVTRYGIAAKRIQILGYGLTRPIADNNSAEGRAINRRTEIYIEETAGRL